MKEREIFDKALAIAAPAERSQYLDEVCGDNERLRGHIEGLLLAHEDLGSFLQSPPVGAGSPTIDQPITEKPGTQIGPYKLLQQLGEGGMGVVYMAEQKEPVKRRVALKIIKPGMDTRQVIARFEAERQALAMMDHPNIAKVLDAGATESGRPYFVMELVNGIPITEYCDEQHLTPKERLRAVRPRLPGRPARSSEGNHPPRSQAVQRAGRRSTTASRCPRSSTLVSPRPLEPDADRKDHVHAARPDRWARWST